MFLRNLSCGLPETSIFGQCGLTVVQNIQVMGSTRLDAARRGAALVQVFGMLTCANKKKHISFN